MCGCQTARGGGTVLGKHLPLVTCRLPGGEDGGGILREGAGDQHDLSPWLFNPHQHGCACYLEGETPQGRDADDI